MMYVCHLLETKNDKKIKKMSQDQFFTQKNFLDLTKT